MTARQPETKQGVNHMSEYTKQAEDFLQKTGTEFKAEFLRNGKYFSDDKEERDIYQITLKRNGRFYSFEFGQSIINSGFYWQYNGKKWNCKNKKNYIDREHVNIKSLSLLRLKIYFPSDFNNEIDLLHYPEIPSSYDVLTCLQKYDVGSFENFCSEFGYNTDSRKAEKTYNAVCNEFKNLQTLFTDSELDELQEIE